MRTILCMLLLWQMCAPLCMPHPIGLLYFTSSLRWQTCTSLFMPRQIGLPYFTLSLPLWQTCMPLCMPHPISLPYFTSSLIWQTWAPLCIPHQIDLSYFTLSLLWQTFAPLCILHQIGGLPYSTSSILWQTCAPLCMPHQVRLPYFTSLLLWLAFTPFTCSCYCLCCCHISSCFCNHHDTNWWNSLVVEECCRGGSYAQKILQWWYGVNNFEVQNRGMKVYGPWASTRQKNSNMLWKQGDNVVVNSMLHQQGDTRLFIYQSCHAIVNQDDSHYTWLTLLRFYLRIWLSPSWILPIAANAFPASVPYQKNEQFQER